MLFHKAFRFRLYPNVEQERALKQQFGASRFVFNYFLRLRMDFYTTHKEEQKQGLTYNDTAWMLTQLKRQPGYEWLQGANSQSLQQALLDLDSAYRNFFQDRARFPKFKSKRSPQSFCVPQHFDLDAENRRLTIPKLTPLKVVAHRPTTGRMKHVTISHTPAGKYYAAITCEMETRKPASKTCGREIGLDMGLKSFMAASDGEKVDASEQLRKSERRLTRLQHQLSLKEKGSRSRDKARLRVARLHEKIANQRADFLHKLSRRLIDESQTIYVEDLCVKGMLANHHLAKSISDASWSEFLRQLAYKGQWYGCRVEKIERFFPSSKRCHCCGHVNHDLLLSEREWECPVCHEYLDRDINAAINILNQGVGREPPEPIRRWRRRTMAIAEAGSPWL
jgi:putative transposase